MSKIEDFFGTEIEVGTHVAACAGRYGEYLQDCVVVFIDETAREIIVRYINGLRVVSPSKVRVFFSGKWAPLFNS